MSFIQTRSIHENIVVAQELLCNLRNVWGKTGYFVIKLDLSKAYDGMKWTFMNYVLLEMGLRKNLITLVMNCIEK